MWCSTVFDCDDQLWLWCSTLNVMFHYFWLWCSMLTVMFHSNCDDPLWLWCSNPCVMLHSFYCDVPLCGGSTLWCFTLTVMFHFCNIVIFHSGCDVTLCVIVLFHSVMFYAVWLTTLEYVLFPDTLQRSGVQKTVQAEVYAQVRTRHNIFLLCTK